MESSLQNLPSYSTLAFSSAISILCAVLFRRYHKLRHVPGPFIASFTNLWRASIQYSGDLPDKLISLHNKFGPLVRIGPNTISVSDPGSLNTIYPSHGEFQKADSYGPLRVFANGRSNGTLIDMQDEKQNAAIKRGIGGAFSIKKLLDYEPDIDLTLQALIERIQQHTEFDLFLVMKFYQIDFLIKMAFSENAGNLEKGEDTMGMAHAGYQRFSHWVIWQPLPYLERFIFQNPLWNRITRQPARWATMGVEKMEARLASNVPQEPKDLLQKYLDASEKFSDIIQKDTIVRLVNSTISAGADTTAMTLTGILYFLMKNPPMLDRLRKEIEGAVAAGRLSFPCRFQDVNRLPYLDAVIKENQRFNPVITIPLERVVPAKGAVIVGKYIPGGTTIGCSSTVLHRNRSIYGKDVDEFNPERWLIDDQGRKSSMERTLIGFGGGNRICLGSHIAILEIKKVIPTLVAKFEMSLLDPGLVHSTKKGFLGFEIDHFFVNFRKRGYEQQFEDPGVGRTQERN